jgi:hypothetical protein
MTSPRCLTRYTATRYRKSRKLQKAQSLPNCAGPDVTRKTTPSRHEDALENRSIKRKQRTYTNALTTTNITGGDGSRGSSARPDLRSNAHEVAAHDGSNARLFVSRYRAVAAMCRYARGFRPGQVRTYWGNGARGRSRTDTLLRAADFPPTSAFAAPMPGSWSGARLHHGRLRGFRCPPSALYTFPLWHRGLGSASARESAPRAFTEFDGLHPVNFSPGAQIIALESAASTNSATRAPRDQYSATFCLARASKSL